jgi:putative ABC transport system ATP-binding protein
MKSPQNHPVLVVDNVTKQLKVGEVTVDALKGVSLIVNKGEFVAVIGPSGSGKSTLLGLMGGLDTPTSGTISIDDVNITNMNERELTRIRNEKIGFIFQSFNLIPTLSAQENVALPAQFSRIKNKITPTNRAKELLTMFGIGDRNHHRPSQLSGGQQQRVAIARSLVNDPPLLMADEPTGNLDSASTQIVMQAFRHIQKTIGTTIIVVTHDMDIASQADRVITIVDGKIADDKDTRANIEKETINVLRNKHITGELPKLEV